MFSFFDNKNILITGHTGFKGSWLSYILSQKTRANVTGYALIPEPGQNLFSLLNLDQKINSVIGDIRDIKRLREVFRKNKPDIVVHLAAQPLVKYSYDNPVYTYETNVMGTVNLLECFREADCVRSALNVTTDKVYENKEWVWGYREDEVLNGFDPYSNSKSCSELVTHSYRQSFFTNREIAISTARAGNVIGGGDFSLDRIIPDCVKAATNKETIKVRNPFSIRPYQHVLEPLFAYLMILKKQYEDISYSGAYNIGPNEKDCITTKTLVELFCRKWGEEQKWQSIDVEGPHEANFLKLDCSKFKAKYFWQPRWNIDLAVENTVNWFKEYLHKSSIEEFTERQINEFIDGEKINV